VKIINISSTIPNFRAVKFNTHFSIVLGIAKSRGEGKSHNLGKTTLIELIDHILFGSRDSDRIKAIKANFEEPVFSIDLISNGEPYSVTVDYSKKKKPAFPKEVKQAYEYFIRFQDDYKDEFRKISVRGKDITWKPLLLKLMGFNERSLLEKYEIEATISDYTKFIQIAVSSSIQREGRQQEIENLTTRREEIIRAIDSLDFSNIEDITSIELASKIDTSILDLKKQIFINRKELSAISEALSHNVFVDFSSRKIEEIYADIKVYFGEQLQRDLFEVKDFFEQVSKNRTIALNAIKKKIIDKINDLDGELSLLTKKRAEYLKIIVSSDAIEIYKDLSSQLAQVETELSLLKQDIYKDSIQTATAERNILKTKQLSLAAAVATEIDENDSKFSLIKGEYSKIMSEVMDIDAELKIEKNSTGNVEFKTMSWRDGAPSQELKGEMAKKISCAAFDVALRIVNNEDSGFIIHDGVIDNADKNIKKKFIDAMKSRATKHNFQYILTAISDDLPESVQPSDIVITLTDRSEHELLMGRSF
jgi:uncharacterized protein YydD (DUF2326 family)